MSSLYFRQMFGFAIHWLIEVMVEVFNINIWTVFQRLLESVHHF